MEPVIKQRAFVPVSLEVLIDAGLATPEEIAEYEALVAGYEARYRALPRRVRLRIQLLSRWRRIRGRWPLRWTSDCDE